MNSSSQIHSTLPLEGERGGGLGLGHECTTLYTCQGTCSKAIEVKAKDGIIESVTFFGGCNGNTKGITKLVQGMEVDKVINLLRGTTCGARPTSCPDQLSHALEQLKAESHA
ncbi:MAG: TIGR03905 family TSCPD domain-containing protein [Bacteroidaceae bacterium]|nr:TIGR03905 family TSCPD domain-containing protein [Bacteroidaceae bacterium]MBR0433934.1 TIGR03905 family TSCPD domain-containing protein [Bacteroidaceae bacterium]